MQKIVEILLRKFLSFNQTQYNFQMMKMILIVLNMSSPTQKQQLYRFQYFRRDYEDAWILDTGTTQHMTFRRDFF